MKRRVHQALLLLLFIAAGVCATNHRLEDASIEEICGKFKPRGSKNRIAGGYGAARGEYPSYVHVRAVFDNEIRSDCGGTIVSEWLIITAAHCLQAENATLEQVEVKAGSIRRTSGVRLVAGHFCLQETPPNEWSRCDLAVLVLEQAIKFTEFIQPACMPSSEPSVGEQVYAVGFGKMGLDDEANEMQVLPLKRPPGCVVTIWPSNICLVSSDPNHVGLSCAGEFEAPSSLLVVIVIVTIFGIENTNSLSLSHFQKLQRTRVGQPTASSMAGRLLWARSLLLALWIARSAEG